MEAIDTSPEKHTHTHTLHSAHTLGTSLTPFRGQWVTKGLPGLGLQARGALQSGKKRPAFESRRLHSLRVETGFCVHLSFLRGGPGQKAACREGPHLLPSHTQAAQRGWSKPHRSADLCQCTFAVSNPSWAFNTTWHPLLVPDKHTPGSHSGRPNSSLMIL